MDLFTALALLVALGFGLLGYGLCCAAGRTSRQLDLEEWQRKVREIREVSR